MNPIQILTGTLLGVAVALGAWRVRALSRNGAYSAAVTGGFIFGLGGLPWAVLLIAFFVSSSALSRIFAHRKKHFDEKFSKGSQRDWGQVAANGGLGTLLVIGHVLFPNETWPWIGYIGAMAAVNADTWATELGVLSRAEPRLITTGRQVEKGTSGAVSLLGTAASFSGAAFIGTFAVLFQADGPASGLVGLAAMAGLAGSLADSLLGATMQAIYYCPVCEKETEKHPMHNCGNQSYHLRGWRWLNNDWVNVAASLVGAATIVLGWNLFF